MAVAAGSEAYGTLRILTPLAYATTLSWANFWMRHVVVVVVFTVAEPLVMKALEAFVKPAEPLAMPNAIALMRSCIPNVADGWPACSPVTESVASMKALSAVPIESLR
jgi:hypothetical protein